MQGSLGERIGEGAFSDVHAWAPGQVVKLLKTGVPRGFGEHEARILRAAFAAGAPVPDALGEVTVDGRFGIVLTRLDGPTLLQLSRNGGMTFEQAGAALAAVCLSVHQTPPPQEVPTLRDGMDGTLRFLGDMLPNPIAAAILFRIERLPQGDGLCHCDLHPGNVIVTAGGARIIDWSGAVRAPAALDLAVCDISLTHLAPAIADNPARPRAVNAAMQAEYARLAGMSPSALSAAVAPYLPVAGTLLLPGVAPAQRAGLIQRIAADLQVT